jgi:hypothetical protein
VHTWKQGNGAKGGKKAKKNRQGLTGLTVFRTNISLRVQRWIKYNKKARAICRGF